MLRGTLYRIAGTAGLSSAALAIAALIGFLVVVGSDKISAAALTPAFFVPTVAALASTICLVIALVGLYLAQEQELGRSGLIAFLVALAGTCLAAGAQWTYVFALPYFSEAVPQLIDESSGTVLAGFLLSYAVLAIGWTWFGVASLKAGVFSRRAAITMIVGGAIAFLPMPSRTLILSLAVASLAVQLRRRTEPVRTEPL